MRRQKRGWALAIFATVLRRPLLILTKQDWSGAENLPREGGCVVVVNHVSQFDPFSCAHFIYDNGRLPRFLGKAAVFKLPVLGRILAAAGQIPVYRETEHAAEAFSAAVAAVQRGECVVIYPEGTISRDRDLWPMVGKTGAARVAFSTGCPVIPCAQWGPQEILAPYARRPHLFPRKVMRIRAGEPVDLDDLRVEPIGITQLVLGTARIMAAMTSQLEQIRGEAAPEQRFDPVAAGLADTGNPYRTEAPHGNRQRAVSDGLVAPVEPIDTPQPDRTDHADVASSEDLKEQPS
ncbi:MAG: 1-acyl-sn-glycerol-3-phosphate acyltransferase [Nocardioidaceae bacterium]|nr:1-acyl-sn-glycerol-3-phosphate acyltransferase [Nocardioidaceae bacterium]